MLLSGICQYLVLLQEDESIDVYHIQLLCAALHLVVLLDEIRGDLYIVYFIDQQYADICRGVWVYCQSFRKQSNFFENRKLIVLDTNLHN